MKFDDWPALCDPILSQRADYEDVRTVLEHLQHEPLAECLFGWWSHQVFTADTAPNIQESTAYSTVLSIEHDISGLILIGYGDCGCPWGQGTEDGPWVRRGNWAYCTVDQACKLVTRIIVARFAERGEQPCSQRRVSPMSSILDQIETYTCGRTAALLGYSGPTATSLLLIQGVSSCDDMFVVLRGCGHIQMPTRWTIRKLSIITHPPNATCTLVDEKERVSIQFDNIQILHRNDVDALREFDGWF